MKSINTIVCSDEKNSNKKINAGLFFKKNIISFPAELIISKIIASTGHLLTDSFSALFPVKIKRHLMHFFQLKRLSGRIEWKQGGVVRSHDAL
ncbi:MAG: hypothetical protein PHV39_02885 [Methanomicrobium sp.]|nr:hypothetical protein [Methanomicrobium sp.]